MKTDHSETKKRSVDRGRRSFEFAWPVEQEHQWIEAMQIDLNSVAVGPKSKYLVGTGSLLLYKPLESATGLFKNFSRIDRKPTAFQAFADKYGMLGVSTPLIRRKGTDVIIEGESYDQWSKELVSMQRAVQLWDSINAYQNGKQTELRKLIEWRERNAVQYHSGAGNRAWIATINHHPELLERMKYPELMQPALFYLQRMVDEKLKQCSSNLQLLWDRGKLRAFIRPQSLIACMWLQLALAIEGDRQYRSCEGCGRWFEVGGGQKRSDAETCGPSCRKRRERARKGKRK